MKFLVSSVHPLALRLAIDEVDIGLKAFYSKLISLPVMHVKPELERIMKVKGLTAYKAGSDYARSFFPFEKLGWVPEYSYTDDIKKLLASLDVRPSKGVMDEIHKAIEQGSGPPVEKLAPKLGYDTAKAVARTTLMNIFVKGSLIQWHQDGIQHVKRLAVEDNKTCPVCRGLNGKEYAVIDLIDMYNPQSFDTHSNCRCTFIPIISLGSYSPKHGNKMPFVVNIKTGGNEVKDCPIELAGMLQEALQGARLPFKVRFDTSIKADYERRNGELLIHPKTLSDEDIRGLIFSEEAEMLWPDVKDKVVKEYSPMVRQGFARSAKSWDNEHELFINNFVAFRLGQLDNDLWSQVFFRSIKS
jgi:SPP1 gp7 family putative phage head morphogenesis protein